MHCWIYRSSKQDEMYLYLDKSDDFSAVPDMLMQRFGQAEYVMFVDLAARESLARVDISVVRQALKEQGYFLQMPPKINALDMAE